MDVEEWLDDNSDPRATLGVRPGGRPGRPVPQQLPQLQLQLISSSDSVTSSRPPSPRNTSPRKSRGGPIRAISSATSTSGMTNITISTDSQEGSGGNIRRLRRPTLSRKQNAAALTANRGQYETQKLLGHLLDRLETRRKGPDILSRAVAASRTTAAPAKKHSVAQISKAVAAATVRKTTAAGKALAGAEEDEEYDDVEVDEGGWDTDTTYDLLEQCRGLLFLADKQGLDLFGESGIAAAEAANVAAKKKRVGGRFPSISGIKQDNSDNVFGSGVNGPTLLKRLAAAVQSVIATDCLYLTQRFRLLKPPYALQTMVLDVAALLYHKGDLEIKVTMMNAVIDGLYTIGAPMRDIICQWLEGRMGELLRRLARERGAIESRAPVDFNDPFAMSPVSTNPGADVPTFAISGPEDGTQKPATTKQQKGWMRYSPIETPVGTPRFQWPDKVVGVLSTHATSNVSAAALQIAALVPRMLVAITSTIDLNTSNLTTIHCVYRLLSLILTAKPDAGIDLLEIIANAPPVARRRGMDIIATYHPQTVGHNIYARRPALTTYAAHRAKWETGQDKALQEEDTLGHHYLPWRCDEVDQLCKECEQQCYGFCVRCSLCSELKHFNCLKELNVEAFEYEVIILAAHGMASRAETVCVRFSLVAPRMDEMVISGRKSPSTATERTVGKHKLHMVNLFTLTLCDECRQPLWGTSCQAYACLSGCQRFFHPICVDAMSLYKDPACQPGREVYLNPEASGTDDVLDPFTTSGVAIHESFKQFKNHLCYDPSQLGNMSYDEVAYLYGNVWLQHELYLNGLSVGSLRLIDVPLEDDITGIALLLNQYEVKLNSLALQPSPAMIDFANVSSGAIPEKGCLLWHIQYLQYCAALVRAPPDPAALHNGSLPDGSLLTVDGIPGSPDPSVAGGDLPTMTYEQVPMRVVQQCLASDLHLRDDLAASTLLEQLRALGLISVPNIPFIDIAVVDRGETPIITPLPLLMDSSPAVELLVLAIEGLLEDFDLTANEQALSLLVKLAWPTPMCSPYAMSRLGGAVMSWIMDEDDVLHYIVKNYGSKRKRPPGVRNAPGMAAAGGGTTAVAAYKDDRIRLLRHYAAPWLEALCRLDPVEYTELAYERSKNIENKYESVELPEDEGGARIAAITLERMMALADSDVMFSGSLELLTMWLEDLGQIIDNDFVFKPLPRLLRHANGHDVTQDIWSRADQISDLDTEGFERVCRWIRALTFSGVVVPWSVITRLVDKHAVGRSADESLFNLIVAVDANTAPIDPPAFAELCNDIFIPLAASMALRTTVPEPREVEMLRISMLSLLRAYGTPPEAIAETSLTTEAEVKAHATQQKRKPSVIPLTAEPSSIQMHSEVVFATARILHGKHNPVEVVLDFLWLLLSKAAGIDNMQGFVHHVTSELAELLWPLYDRQSINRRSRARVFVKLLTINSAPIEQLVQRELEQRTAVTRERLLEFVLELADESLCAEVKGWRRASVGLVCLFFNAALQPLEPDAETLVIWKALLPTQLEAITACFEEYLESCPDEQRLQLLVQLLRLRSLLPTWPIVGWTIIDQIVTEQLTSIRQFEGHDSVQAIAAVAEARNIRAAVLALGMYMLSTGVECEWMMLQRFQQHVASALATPWPAELDTITGVLLPALKTLLDSTVRITVYDSSGRSKETTLVGSIFLSIIFNSANIELHTLDFIAQRCVLDLYLVVFFKHNVQPYELSAMTLLQNLSTFSGEDNPSENRLLALQILRTTQHRTSNERFSRVLPPLFVRAADIMYKETKADGDGAIIESCRAFLQASIEEFGRAGLFLQVLRSELVDFSAPEAIGRAMAIAAKTGDKQSVWLDQVILDLPEVFRWDHKQMSRVFKSLARLSATLDGGFTVDSALEFGAFLSRLGKHAVEWDANEMVDMNPVLQTCSALLSICPSEAQLTLLHQISNFLHMIAPRYVIRLEQIRKLVPVSIKVSRRQQTENTVATVLFEICGAALRGLNVSAITLKSLIDWLGDQEDTSLEEERKTLLVSASAGCGAILTRTHPTLMHLNEPELAMGIFKGAATVIVRAEMQLQGNTGRVLRNLPNEAAATQLDVFAHILYASLEMRLGPARERLMSLYPVLGRATSLSLFACADLLSVPDPSGDGSHLASAAFVVMRLAILAVNDPPPKDGTFDISSVESHDVLISFWNRLWPEWERLLGLSVAPSCVNLPQRAVTISVLMDVILFISANNPSLLVEPAPTIARGLATLEEWHHAAGNTVPAKIGKAAAALDAAALRAQPAANARRTAVSAVWTDMLATERLFSLRAEFF